MHKIATCCYCGTRAALVLRGHTRHELSCAACGAPLHEMKAIPRAKTKADDPPGERRRAATRAATLPKHGAPHMRGRPPERVQRRLRRKSGMRFLRGALEEIWDTVEDSVEDIFD